MNFMKHCEECNNKCDGRHCNVPGLDFAGNDVFVTAGYFLLTENCNLRCKYCFEGSSRNVKKVMSSETAHRGINLLCDQAEQAYQAGYTDSNVSITFFGGEPLLNTELAIEIINYTEERVKHSKVSSHY